MFGMEVQRNDSMTQIALGTREYGSIEEFKTAEGIRLLLPTWLPDGLEVENIIITYDYNGDGWINVFYDDRITVLHVALGSEFPDDIVGAEVYEHDNISFYVFNDYNVISWEYGGDFYNFVFAFDITEHSQRIIENMRGLN
jgi:hypothetical protein